MTSNRIAASASAAALALALACSRGGDDGARGRVFSRSEATPAPAAFDWSRPTAALEMGGDEVAARLGAFEWTAAVDWTVSRQGDDGQRVHAAERHGVRQAASGEFAVDSEIDPGQGPGSDTGKEIIWAGGMTYGRARHAPFRQRPTDRGRDARRYRDETFQAARSVARLYGEALAVSDAGETTFLGRRARKFRLALASGAGAPPREAARPAGAPAPDEDTKRRVAFLSGRVPVALDGELILDGETGAPLRVRMAGAFGVSGDPRARAAIELLAEVKATGAAVAAVQAPRGALPDDRKPAGVAGALEAAGLKKAGEGAAGREEPTDEAGE